MLVLFALLGASLVAGTGVLIFRWSFGSGTDAGCTINYRLFFDAVGYQVPWTRPSTSFDLSWLGVAPSGVLASTCWQSKVKRPFRELRRLICIISRRKPIILVQDCLLLVDAVCTSRGASKLAMECWFGTHFAKVLLELVLLFNIFGIGLRNELLNLLKSYNISLMWHRSLNHSVKTLR